MCPPGLRIFQPRRSNDSGPKRPDPRPAPVRVHHAQLPHYLPGLLHWLVRLCVATLLVLWKRTGKDQYFHRLARFWTKIFAVSFAMGVSSRGFRFLLPVRDELGAFLRGSRQCDWAADRLRSADGVFPRGHVSRRHALWLEARGSLAARNRRHPGRARYGHLRVLDPCRQ